MGLIVYLEILSRTADSIYLILFFKSIYNSIFVLKTITCKMMNKIVMMLFVAVSMFATQTEACSAQAVGGSGRLAFLCKTDAQCAGCGSACHFNNDGRGVKNQLFNSTE